MGTFFFFLYIKWKLSAKENLPLSSGKRNLGKKLPFRQYSTDTQWVENLFSKCVLAIHFNLSHFKEGRQSLPNSSKVQGPPPPAATSQGKLTGEETAPFPERPDRIWNHRAWSYQGVFLSLLHEWLSKYWYPVNLLSKLIIELENWLWLA